MAVRIQIVATTRDGQRLETVEVHGKTFHETSQEQKEVYQRLKDKYKDSSGIPPYIFTHTHSEQ